MNSHCHQGTGHCLPQLKQDCTSSASVRGVLTISESNLNRAARTVPWSLVSVSLSLVIDSFCSVSVNWALAMVWLCEHFDVVALLFGSGHFPHTYVSGYGGGGEGEAASWPFHKSHVGDMGAIVVTPREPHAREDMWLWKVLFFLNQNLVDHEILKAGNSGTIEL